ncbi:MAG TPA: MmcQ/YjbR family DNA-binding protein [Crocinitomix sp.]|nr:MmcQ/YjbR family DNA-binding protein [Crocinitomix sp.]
MDIETLRNYCLNKKGVTESFPFDEKILVFKVMGKMFALCNIDDYTGVNLKCNPEYAIELREKHIGITPGFHMNKKHWNTVSINSDVPPQLLTSLIDLSYTLVVKGLTKKQREGLD